MKMESKFIIFVAFATLTQSACAHQSTVYGLSEVQSTEYTVIVQSQESVILEYYEAINPLFDIIEKFSAIRRYNQLCEIGDISPVIAEALLNAKDGADGTFTALLKIRGGASAAIEIAQDAAHAELDIIYAQVELAIKLILSKNYNNVRAQVEVFALTGHRSIQNYITIMYDLIRTIVNTDDADTLAAIKTREKAALDACLRVNNAYYDAIRVSVTTIAFEGNNGVAVIPDIRSYRKQAAYGLKDHTDLTYSLIRALFVSTQLNKPKIIGRLMSDQYTQIISKAKYMEASDIMLDVIRGYLTRIQFGLSTAHDDDLSAIDAAQSAAAAAFRTALRALVDSVPTLDPITSTAVKVAAEFLIPFADTAAAAYFGAIRLAISHGSTYSVAISKIEAAEAALNALHRTFVSTIFTLIQVGSILTGGNANLQTTALAAADTYVKIIFAQSRLLAKAYYDVEPVTEAHFRSLELAAKEINNAVSDFTSTISYGHVSVFSGIVAVGAAIVSVPAAVIPAVANVGVGLIKTGFNLFG